MTAEAPSIRVRRSSSSPGGMPNHDRADAPAAPWDLPSTADLNRLLRRDLSHVMAAARSLTVAPGSGPLAVDRPVRVEAVAATGFEAEALGLPGGGRLIRFNQGLILYLYNFERIVGAHLAFDDEPVAGPAPTPAEAARRICELLDWTTGPLMLPRIRTFEVTPAQIRKASEMASIGQFFTVAHEVGHVLLGHDDKAAPPDTPDGIRPAWGAEFAADGLALSVLVRAVEQMGQTLHPQTYAAVESLFHAMHFLQIATGRFDTDFHPSATKRRQVLRTYAVRLRAVTDPSFFGPAVALEQMFRTWEPLVVRQWTERPATVDRELGRLLALTDGDEFDARLRRLLDEYPTATLARARELARRLLTADRAGPALSIRNIGRLVTWMELASPPAVRNEFLAGLREGDVSR